MIVTICGSARFCRWINAWHRALTLSGHAVFDKGMPPLEDTKQWMTPEQQATVRKVMHEKIAMSRAVVCINPFAYMGDDTLGFRDFAFHAGREIYTLESWGKGCGVGANHSKAWRRAKEAFSIPADFMSPIDTASDWRNPFDLLGPSGELYSRLVRMVEAPKVDVLKSIETLLEKGAVV